MHATIDVRFELSIDDDKTLPLATLAEAVTDQNLEAVLLESLVESLDAASVEALCGEKHAHGNGDQRFQRAGTDTRTAVTTAGEHEFSLHYVEDTAASPDESSYFRPVEDVLDFDGQNRYQQDIAAKASISLPRSAIETLLPITATASSRCRRRPPSTAVPRNTATSSNSSFQTVSLAQTLTPSFLTGQSATAKTTTARPTPSKQRSAKTPPKSHAPCWICRSTLTGTKLPPNSMISAQSLTTRRSSVTLIAASSQPLPTKTVTTKTDLVHVGRTLGYTLWDDGVFSLDRRKEIVSEVIDEVFHLKNSVAKHRPAEEFAAIRSRIARTRERLEKTAWQLEQFGSAKAAGYLRRWLPSIVTFAEHAVEGFEVPWTSNPVERLMGEVSKRCKNQWMRWTAEGLEAILQLRLVKYADPEYYQAFLDELLQRSTKTAINCDLSIESTSGKV